MKLRWLILALLCSVASASTIYVSQSGGSVSCGADGTQITISVSTLNGTSGDWAAGNSLRLCGNITTQIVADGSGTSGSPITILFETNGSMTAPVWGTSGAIYISGFNYITVNGNAGAGVVSNTANGDGLANNQQSGAITIQNATGITVEYLTIQNICQRVTGTAGDSCTTGGNDTNAVALNNPLTNVTIEYTTISDSGHSAIFYSGGSSDTGVLISRNTISESNWGVGVDGTTDGFTLDGNDISCVVANTCNWNDSADVNHHNGIIMFPTSGNMNNVQISNNYFHDINGNTTGYIFLDPSNPGNLPNNLIFNNVFFTTSGQSGPGNGMITSGIGVTGTKIYNNTMYGPGTRGFGADTNAVMENNIADSEGCLLYVDSGASGDISAYNDFYNWGSPPCQSTGQGWFNGSTGFTTLAGWQTGSTSVCSGGCDVTGSINTNPNLTSQLAPNSGSPVIGTGANLTSLGITALEQDAPYTFGINYACGGGCTSRPSTGGWPIGAYQYVASQATPPTCTPTSGNAPQSLTCLNTNGGTTVMCEAISPVTPVTNGLGTGCTTGNSLGTGSSESFSVLIGATYEFVAGTSTLADSNPTSYTFGNCPAQYQAGTPGLPNYGGIRIDQCVANIGAIPNLWTNYSADHGFSGAGTSATNDFGNKICRITDGNSDPSQIGGTFTTNYSGSDVDQHIAVDGSMFTIGRDGASYSLLYIYNGIGCPQQVQTSPGVPYEIPTKITAFSQSASTPHLLHVMNITQGGPSPVISVNSSGTYTGTIAAGSSNNLVNDYGIVSGFGAGGNIASPILISASTNTSVTFSGVTTTPQSCPGTCTLTVVSQAQIQNYDLSSCTVSSCSPAITTVYDFAQGTELNWANGFQPSWSSVWRWSLDDTTSSIAFSNNQGAAGGQNTGTLVATYKVGSGARVMNTGPASATVSAVDGSGDFTCVCPGASSNLFVGQTVTVTGFSHSNNNIANLLITASTANQFTVTGASTTSETNSATAAFFVAGIAGQAIVGDYGPVGSVAMTNCNGVSGACSTADAYNIHDMYQFGANNVNYVVGERCLNTTSGCTGGTTDSVDQPYAWQILTPNVLATGSDGHFGVGFDAVMHGTNSPQGQTGLFQIVSPEQTTYPNLNAVSLYGDWQNPPCIGPSCAGGSGTASATSQTNGIASPSLDGRSMELSLTCGAQGTSQTCNVLWPYILPANNNLTTFTGTYSVYLPSVSNVQALEYDMFQFTGTRYMFGSQCSSPTLADGLWQIWNQFTATWVNTTAPCTLLTTPNVWHSITWNVHRVVGDTSCSGNPCLYYDQLIVDGTSYGPFTPQETTTSGDSPAFGIQFQIDQGATAGTSIEYLDQVNFTAGGSLVTNPTSLNIVSTTSPDNLPNPGAITLDIHCSWNENLGNDYYPVECGNTTVAINQAESPAHFANNGCDQHGYLQSPPNCLTTNLFTGPLVNELIIYPTAPIGGPTCTSAPCSTLPLLRLGNGYISAVSNDFSAANLIESIAPTGGYVLYSADHMGTLGSTSISVTSFTGTSGTLTFQAVNAFTAGNTITFGGFAGSNTGLNGQTVTVLSTGLSGSQFEATVSGVGYSSGRGQIVDPPPYILGGLTWQGGATAGSHAYNGGDVITPLDSNAPNCTYHALAAGNSSGSTEPTWVSGGLCITSNITDNTVTWVYDGMQNMRGDVFMVKTGITNVVIPPNNFLLLGSIYANRLFDGGY